MCPINSRAKIRPVPFTKYIHKPCQKARSIYDRGKAFLGPCCNRCPSSSSSFWSSCHICQQWHTREETPAPLRRLLPPNWPCKLSIHGRAWVSASPEIGKQVTVQHSELRAFPLQGREWGGHDSSSPVWAELPELKWPVTTDNVM